MWGMVIDVVMMLCLIGRHGGCGDDADFVGDHDGCGEEGRQPSVCGDNQVPSAS